VQDPAENGHVPTDSRPWEDELIARSSWVSAEQRDARAEAADGRAADRDTAARGRDDTADGLVRDARTREERAYRRILEVTQRLNAADAGEGVQWLHLQQAGAAIQEAIDCGADEPLAGLLRQVLRLLDVQFADVIAAGIQRAGLRADLQHAGQQLAGGADDRTAAAADRAAAAADRAAAAHDREDARTARRSAAAYRAADDQPGSPS
jgi:hypothetical protein